MKNIDEWLKSGSYLPEPMRDFHECKDLFKCIDEIPANPGYDKPDWVNAHVYTVDYFLWFMAQHGYTLQRNRSDIAFYNLDATVADSRQSRAKFFADAFHFGARKARA